MNMKYINNIKNSIITIIIIATFFAIPLRYFTITLEIKYVLPVITMISAMITYIIKDGLNNTVTPPKKIAIYSITAAITSCVILLTIYYLLPIAISQYNLAGLCGAALASAYLGSGTPYAIQSASKPNIDYFDLVKKPKFPLFFSERPANESGIGSSNATGGESRVGSSNAPSLPLLAPSSVEAPGQPSIWTGLMTPEVLHSRLHANNEILKKGIPMQYELEQKQRDLRRWHDILSHTNKRMLDQVFFPDKYKLLLHLQQKVMDIRNPLRDGVPADLNLGEDMPTYTKRTSGIRRRVIRQVEETGDVRLRIGPLKPLIREDIRIAGSEVRANKKQLDDVNADQIALVQEAKDRSLDWPRS